MRIVCDVDECVAEYLGGFCKFYNETRGASLKHSDFETFSFQDTLGIGDAEAVRISEEYMRSEYFDNMRFVSGAREGILRLMEKNRVDFVTVRPNSHKFKTRKFFAEGFPGRDFDIYFEKGGVGGSKLDRIRELRADVVIEDSVASLEYAEAGFRVLLFDRAWNRDVKHGNIYRCENWGEVVQNV